MDIAGFVDIVDIVDCWLYCIEVDIGVDIDFVNIDINLVVVDWLANYWKVWY